MEKEGEAYLDAIYEEDFDKALEMIKLGYHLNLIPESEYEDGTNTYGGSAFFSACRNEKISQINFMLENNVALPYENWEGMSCIHFTLNDYNLTKLLLENNFRPPDLIYFAILTDNIEIFKLVFKYIPFFPPGNCFTRVPFKKGLIHLKEMFDIIFESGWDMYTKSDNGTTFMDNLIYSDNSEQFIEELRSRGYK